MKKSKLVAATAMVSITGLAGSALAALPANAATHSSPRSLATVLTSDGNKFDKNGKDFDVVTEAVLAVLAAKPDSAVKVLADPSVKLTAFIPTDKAFLKLASDLTGKKVTSEKKAFTTVAGLGIDTVETVLLYHVVAGSKINAKAALKANGATLTTAQGGTFTVKVSKRPSIQLRDNDPNSRNPRVVLALTDINKGKQNQQIAHGIDRVLRPVDL
ncbi:MAG: fasciclin domain-containing protein [Candidatus Nanopelagicales bacterium]